MGKLSIPTKLESLKPIVEAMIFASEEPLGPRALLRLLFEEEKKEIESNQTDEQSLFEAGEDESKAQDQESEGEGETVAAVEPKFGQKELRTIIDELNEVYEDTGRSFRIIEIAGGFQFATTREYGEFVGLLSKERMRRKLSPAALETLAIVAYRQPVTKPEVEAIRGVNCDQVLLSLLERNLIAISGRADTVGKPLLYSTTDEFLRAFGMNSLSDLPKLRELEELMEEDAYVPSKPQVIPEELANKLLELDYPDAELQVGEGEAAQTDSNGSEIRDSIESSVEGLAESAEETETVPEEIDVSEEGVIEESEVEEPEAENNSEESIFEVEVSEELAEENDRQEIDVDAISEGSEVSEEEYSEERSEEVEESEDEISPNPTAESPEVEPSSAEPVEVESVEESDRREEEHE